jgi:hypothetical protein
MEDGASVFRSTPAASGVSAGSGSDGAPFDVLREHVLHDRRIFEQLVFRVTSFRASAAVFLLFDDVEESVFFQEVPDAAEREAV